MLTVKRCSRFGARFKTKFYYSGGKFMAQRPQTLFLAGKERTAGNAVTYDIDKLIADSTEPSVWYKHLTDDLMKFWDTGAAKTLKNGLFQTYRANNGDIIKSTKKEDLPPEIVAAMSSDDTKGLIDLDYNYIRAHSRQTFAYGVAFNMTGKEEYIRLCRTGVDGLFEAIDRNNGMFTKRQIDSGNWEPAKQERISQDMAYGLTGLAMYYYLTHDETTLYRMVQVKNYIFDAYFDENRGFFTWLPKDRKDGDVEIVSQLDQVYAYMHFVIFALPEPYKSEWKNDLRKIVNILINRFYSERYGFFWGVDSNSASLQLAVDHTDFGHSVKTMWLIYRIGLLVGEPAFVTFAREKIDRILNEAYLEETKSWGRRFNADGTVDEDKEWWICAELDQACALLSLNDPSYLSYLNNTHAFWLKYMVDKENGEIWHMLDGKTNKPVLKFPKVHSWKTSLHSFEHALFGYIISSQIKGKSFPLYYAFPEEKFSKSRVRPYCFDANIVSHEYRNEILFRNGGGQTDDIHKITVVTYDTAR
jgi:mannose/cellobiose epimerase-like protein (N-acyl-D-glucosamine 2-epimerase family)